MSTKKSPSTEKKSLMKKSKLSSTVLDYYYKYGQNRDLEKYLHLRRQNSSKSSSDGSLQNFEKTNSAAETQRIRKSLQKLNLTEETPKPTDQSRIESATENVTKSTNISDQDHKENTNSSAGIKIQKKNQQNLTKKSKSKSYNFNMESSIEINLPPSFSMPSLPFSHHDESSKFLPKSLLESCETQTEPIAQSDAAPLIVAPEITTELLPITAADESKSLEKQQTIAETAQETSPASSIASAKVRLEWDSMADVGYNKVIDFKSQSNCNLSTFEKNALTKFFAKKGLHFDDNLVIIASPDKQHAFRKRELAKSAIEIRKNSTEENWSPYPKGGVQNAAFQEKNLSPKTSKQLWEKALLKYRQKYGKMKRNATATMLNISDSQQSLYLSTPQCQSTPITDAASKGAIPKTSRISGVVEKRSEAKNKSNEKSCQTSIVTVEERGIQVEAIQEITSKSVQIGDGKITETKSEISQSTECEEKSTQVNDRDVTSASSFEFMSPHGYANENEDTEEASVTPKPANDSNSIPHCTNVDLERDSIPLENSDKKEKFSSVEDKENIPPSKYSNVLENVRKLPSPTKPEFNTSYELQKGIDLLNSLVDSKKLDNAEKKKLIRKIVRRLVKAKDAKEISKLLISDSSQLSNASSRATVEKSDKSEKTIRSTTGKFTISGISVLSSSIPLPNESTQIDEKSENFPKEDSKRNIVGVSIQDLLQPMTRSEIEKEKLRKASNLKENNQIEESENSDAFQMVSSNTAKCSDVNICEFIEMEKKSHFNWIDQEIHHLNNLKNLLRTYDQNENNKVVTKNPTRSVIGRTTNSAIYENFQKESSVSSDNRFSVRPATTASTSGSSSRKSESSQISLANKNRWIHKTTIESTPSLSRSDEYDRSISKKRDETVEKNVTLMKFSEWNSHVNMQQLVKNRTKLQTPSSDESIESYARVRHAEFKQKYAKAQGLLYGNRSNVTEVNDPPIYTKPYSSDEYTGLHRNHRNSMSKRNNNNVDAYTSITGSDAFLSSNSISIAVAANSTSNTTTHQYDTKTSIGVQTSDTLKRTQPIQLRQPTYIDKQQLKAKQSQIKHTVRVNKLTINKQHQVRPESIAYVITFKEKTKISGKKIDQKKFYNESSTSETTTTESRNKNVNAKDDLESFTLQQYLRDRNPKFCFNAEERRKCVNELHNLRQQRNEQRKKLFVSNSSNSTLRTNMKRLLPPPPLAQTRLFTSRDIRANTRRKYRKLPEIIEKKHLEKENKMRRNHRMLADIFNKNLQRRVLTGQTDLSNSMTIN